MKIQESWLAHPQREDAALQWSAHQVENCFGAHENLPRVISSMIIVLLCRVAFGDDLADKSPFSTATSRRLGTSATTQRAYSKERQKSRVRQKSMTKEARDPRLSISPAVQNVYALRNVSLIEWDSNMIVPYSTSPVSKTARLLTDDLLFTEVSNYCVTSSETRAQTTSGSPIRSICSVQIQSTEDQGRDAHPATSGVLCSPCLCGEADACLSMLARVAGVETILIHGQTAISMHVNERPPLGTQAEELQ